MPFAIPASRGGRDHTDAARRAAVEHTGRRPLSLVRREIEDATRRSARILGELSDSDLDAQATSRNPRWGLKPAHFIVEDLLIAHVEKHLRQMRRNETQYQQSVAADRPDQQRDDVMTELVFPAQPPASVAVRGRVERFPIHRIFCVGRNYEAHAREMGVAVDREAPFYFTKAAGHSVASGSTVPYPPGTANYHYEMELVVAIGKAGFRVAEAQALDHVFGYACGLDMTRRDLQFAAREKQRPWDLGKDVEQSAVLAEIVPAADVAHPERGRIELRINGETKQSSDLSLLIHSAAAVIAHLSQFYHLQPGDLIYTGTPEGVGPVKPGDRIEGSIEGIGGISLQIADPA